MLGEFLELLVCLCIIVAIASFWGNSGAQRELDQKRKDNNKWGIDEIPDNSTGSGNFGWMYLFNYIFETSGNWGNRQVRTLQNRRYGRQCQCA